MKNVPISDWISLAVGVVGFATAYLAQKDRLPSWARQWLKRVGPERIKDAVERAAAIAEMTPDQRRQQAVIYLQKVSMKDLGFPIPSSVANLLVEYIYQRWKKARS